MDRKYIPEDELQPDESVRRRTELFNQYVLPHKNLIYKLCIRYTFFPGDVADNFNEVLINFFKYIETYDPGRSIQTWLHIVTRRFVADMNRKNGMFKRNDDIKTDDLVGCDIDEGHVSGNCMGMDNYRQHYNDDVLRAIGRLKPIYRDALLLQQAGYKLEEIMEIAHRDGNLRTRNIETIKSRLFLAKQQLRKMINRDGEAIDR